MLRILLVVLGILMACAPGGTAEEKHDGRPRVVTTFLPAYCFASNVAGDLVHVENLLPPGVDPHDYQFTPGDIRRATSADLIVMNGLGLDDWLLEAIQAGNAGGNTRVVKLSDGIPGSLLIENHEGTTQASAKRSEHRHDGGVNPHIWLDPVLAMHSVSNIVNGLGQIDPVNRDGFLRNGTGYLSILKGLNEEAKTIVDSLSHKEIVTYHEAFAYFARRYGLEVVGVVEEVAGVSPSPRHLSDLLRTIREQGIHVIFTESGSPPRLARQLSRDLSVTLDSLDALETGDLNPESYVEGMRRNLRTLEKHLR